MCFFYIFIFLLPKNCFDKFFQKCHSKVTNIIPGEIHFRHFEFSFRTKTNFSCEQEAFSKKNPWHTKRISVRQQYMKDFFYFFLKSWKKEHLSWVCSMNKRNSVRFSSFHLPPMQMASMFLCRTSLLVCIIQMHYGFHNWTLGPPIQYI